MKIIKSNDAKKVAKPEGTNVRYYLFDDYEVHYNEQAPHTMQVWHHHDTIAETLYIIDGELMAFWREGKRECSQQLGAGDVIETERTPHTFSNESDVVTKFLVIKRIPSTKSFREVFKSDKIID